MRALALLAVLGVVACPVWAGDTWPDFRGPTQDGHSDAKALPWTWGEDTNVAWKTAVHGRGWSTPVVWGDQIWVTTASEDGSELFAVCVSYESGEVLYDIKLFDKEDPAPVNGLNSYASCSAVIEEGRVYVHFGTFGTACIDTATGEVIWEREDINCDHGEGPGSSPVIYGDTLILTMDGEDVQYLTALDKKTGEAVWRTDRSTDFPPENDYRLAFSTPFITEIDGEEQLISAGSKGAMAYEPATGRELWQVNYGGWSNTPRALVGHGFVYINIGYQSPELWAVRTGGSGNITNSHVAWKVTKRVPAISSPLLVDGRLYLTADKSYVTCLDATTGAEIWQERIDGTYWASPVYGAGRIYFFDDKGRTTVIDGGREFEILAVNELGDGFMASAAVVGESFVLRSKSHLYRVEE